MFVVLVATITYGVVFGFIQASLDPESHKGAFAIIFSVAHEIGEAYPIGMLLGIFFTCLIEALRQQEMHIKYKGRDLGLDLQSGKEYDQDEEKVSLVDSKHIQSYEGLSLRSDSDEENITELPNTTDWIKKLDLKVEN